MGDDLTRLDAEIDAIVAGGDAQSDLGRVAAELREVALDLERPYGVHARALFAYAVAANCDGETINGHASASGTNGNGHKKVVGVAALTDEVIEFEPVSSRAGRTYRRLARAAAACFLVGSMFTGVAWAASDAEPGSPLYSLREFGWELQASFSTPEEKAEQFADQGETLVINARSTAAVCNPGKLDGAVGAAQRRIDKAREQSLSLEGEAAASAIARLQALEAVLVATGAEQARACGLQADPTPVATEGLPASGKPDDAGKPSDVGKPEDAGKPDDAGKPTDVGKPESAGGGSGSNSGGGSSNSGGGSGKSNSGGGSGKSSGGGASSNSGGGSSNAGGNSGSAGGKK